LSSSSKPKSLETHIPSFLPSFLPGKILIIINVGVEDRENRCERRRRRLRLIIGLQNMM
jgi:hypothetical protein